MKGYIFSIFFLLSIQTYCQSVPVAAPSAYSGSNLVNYMRTWEATAPEADATHLTTRALNDVKQTTVYYDGFGREMQTIAKQASPLGNDLVSAHVYNSIGQEQYTYLPFASNISTSGDITNNGNFKLDAIQQQIAFYNGQLTGQSGEVSGGANWGYSQAVFESSPDRRILSEFAPGVNWTGTQNSTNERKTAVQYLVNTLNDQVQVWNIDPWSLSSPEQNIIPTNVGTYLAGKLYKTIAIDEEGHQSIEFKNSYGQVILKKQQLSGGVDNGTGAGHAGWLCTYYVYDDRGNLRFIITPQAITAMINASSWTISTTLSDQLCYRFEYDQVGHMVVKKVPGTPTGSLGEMWMVYDQRNRMVMEQDGNMRSPAVMKWLYISYDNLDRPITKGLITDPSNYSNLAFHITGASTSSNSGGVSSWPVFTNYAYEVRNQYFYDSYSLIPSTLPKAIDVTGNGSTNTAFSTTYNTSPNYSQPIQSTSMLQGMATGGTTAVLGSSSSLPSVVFYDDKGRTIQTQGLNISGGKDINTTQYSWDGKPLANVNADNYSSTTNPQTHVVISNMTYDACGRVLTVAKTVNSTINGTAVSSPATTVSTYTYDELGRPSTRKLGNNLETLTYDYNIRGWLLGINRNYISGGSSSNYFGEELGYDKSNSYAAGTTFTTPSYINKIGGTVWKSKGDGINRKYDYTYDNANRLTSATFLQNSTTTNWDNGFIDFSQSITRYDGNGNIGELDNQGFVQGGKQPVDQIIYHYSANSNQLAYVEDQSNVANSTLGDLHYNGTKSGASIDFTYDANGNVTSDANRGITSIVYYPGTNLPQSITMAKGTIQYLYDANGNKLQKKINETSVTIPSIVVNNTNLSNVNTSITTTSNYVDGLVYKTLNYGASSLLPLNSPNTDVLQFIGMEDGRIRYLNTTAGFVHDYFICDHQKNVRVTLTDEAQQEIYPAATGETSTVNGGTAQSYESMFYNFNPTDFVLTSSLPSWFNNLTYLNKLVNQNGSGTPTNNDPYSDQTGTSNRVFQLCGNTANNSTGDNYGCGITLKVMAGDQILIYGNSFWHNPGSLPTGSYPVSAVLSSLLGAFGSSGAMTATQGHGALDGAVFNTGSTTPSYTSLSPLLSNQNSQGGTAPYAGINWIIFDDQFKAVSAGFDPVSLTGDQVYTHVPGNGSMPNPINIPKNGYIYVYLSNQSNINVYFDNLQVVHKHGPLVEDQHYYPTGLAMAGISDRAWKKTVNNYHYQEKEMQNGEWYDGSGIEEYDFGARNYDQQLGRWNGIDPASQYSSPYLAMGNSWPNGRDKNGALFGYDDAIVSGVGFVVGYIGYGIGTHHWGGKALLSGLEGAVIAEGGYLTLGGGLAAAPASTSTLVGGMGSMSSALGFSSVYAMSNVSYLAENNSSLSSNSWNTVGTMAAYDALSSIQAGFASGSTQDVINKSLYGVKGASAVFKGATSNVLGGLLTTAGNDLISAGKFKGLSLHNELLGAASNFGASMVHDALELNGVQDVLRDRLTSIGGHFISNYASSVFSSFISNIYDLKHTDFGDLTGANTLMSTVGGLTGDAIPDDDYLRRHF